MKKSNRKTLKEQKLEQINEKEKAISIKTIKGFVRVNKMSREYDIKSNRWFEAYTLSIMNEKGSTIWRKVFETDEVSRIFDGLLKGTEIEFDILPNHKDYNEEFLRVKANGVVYLNDGIQKHIQRKQNEIKDLKNIYERTNKYYDKIEEILNSYKYGELVIVTNRYTKEIVGVDGVSFNSSLYETVNSIIQDKIDIPTEKIKKKINRLDNIISAYTGDIEVIGDLIVYGGRAVRRNKKCSCGREVHYGCNIWDGSGINTDRFCSTCILDYLC